MKRSGLFLSLLLAIIVSSPSLQTLEAATENTKITSSSTSADPFAVKSGVNAVVNDNVDASEIVIKAVAEAPKVAEPKKTVEIAKHTVKAGDSLWRIAQELLGDGNRYRELIEANKAKYPSLEKNPDLIHAGWVLEVPVEKETKPAVDAKQPETTIKPAIETGKKPEPKVEKDSSTPAGKVTKVPQWPIEERVKRLQSSLDSANRALLAQKKRIADINPSTIRFLIDNKFMTEEEWMGMNPPDGCVYRLSRTGKIEVVGSDNKPLTSADMAKLDKKAKDAAKLEATKPVAEVKPNAAQAAADAGLKQAKDEKDKADKAAKDKNTEQAKADAKAKQDAYDKALAQAKAEKEKIAKAANDKIAADKAAAEKATADKEAKGKSDAELAKAAATRYQKMLSEMGAPDLADSKNYYNAVKKGSELLSKGFFGTTAFYKFLNTADYPESNIPAMQRDLREAQKHYEEMVDKNKTSRVLGIFGDTIESAGKKVEQSQQSLAKAWSSMKEALSAATAKAKELESNVSSNKSKVASAQAELAKLDKYDSANADQVQKLNKEMKNLNEQISDDEEKLAGYKELKSTFKI